MISPVSLNQHPVGQLNTSFNGTFHDFPFDKYARRYLGGFCFLVNRRFTMAAMTELITNAVCGCKLCPERTKGSRSFRRHQDWI
jgi:hypothetical protein